jgi:hypothetical protein
MVLTLLDGALMVEVVYSEEDRGFDDDILVRFTEECPNNERLFKADETNICLTPREAIRLAKALLIAAEESLKHCDEEVAED